MCSNVDYSNLYNNKMNNVPVSFNELNFQMCIPSNEVLKSYYPGGNVQSYILNHKVWAEDETKIKRTNTI